MSLTGRAKAYKKNLLIPLFYSFTLIIGSNICEADELSSPNEPSYIIQRCVGGDLLEWVALDRMSKTPIAKSINNVNNIWVQNHLSVRAIPWLDKAARIVYQYNFNRREVEVFTLFICDSELPSTADGRFYESVKERCNRVKDLLDQVVLDRRRGIPLPDELEKRNNGWISDNRPRYQLKGLDRAIKAIYNGKMNKRHVHIFTHLVCDIP